MGTAGRGVDKVGYSTPSVLENKMVYLIGAGPGDPGLITVKGLEFIKQCDTIIYDRLGTYQLLEMVKPDNVVICCSGKNPPEEETLRELERLDIPAWETADGNVYAVSDGKTVRMRQGR